MVILRRFSRMPTMTLPDGPADLPSSEDRQQIALAPPTPGLLVGFPASGISASKPLYRAHHIERSSAPWWFSNDGTGRFDLSGDSGTCYLAEGRSAALREALGRRQVTYGVERSELTSRAVSRLFLPMDIRVANTTSAHAADHGVTREISTVVPYVLTQAWAQAWFETGFRGVRYMGRFSAAITSEARCLAIFGSARRPTAQYKADPAPVPALETAVRIQMRIIDIPNSTAGLTILEP